MKLYPYTYLLLPQDNGEVLYRIIRLNSLSLEYELMGDIFTNLMDCQTMIEELNQESGTITVPD